MIPALIEFYKNILYKNNYGSELERYILSHNPIDISDVERLTRQFDEDLAKNRI